MLNMPLYSTGFIGYVSRTLLTVSQACMRAAVTRLLIAYPAFAGQTLTLEMLPCLSVASGSPFSVDIL